MSSVAVPVQTAVAAPSRTRADMAALVVAGVALWLPLLSQLSGEWSVNEQYSYGWFVPLFAAYLFWLRWEDRPGREGRKSETRNSKSEIAGAALLLLLLLLPLRVFEIGNPDWRPLSWLHAIIVVALTLLYIGSVGGAGWVRHFAFPVCFIFVAVPWVSGIESPVVQGLMRVVAAIATETLTLFGIPAQLEGSTIRINAGLVGVNEACSGVRSLQTSLMIGLLFGELKRLSASRRVLLVVAAVAIAFVANCGRAFFLVWLAATRNLRESANWHDIAGYTIVVLVLVGTMLIASRLGRRATESTGQESATESRYSVFGFRIFRALLVSTLAWLLIVELAAHGWYRAHERTLVAGPRWTVRPPQEPGLRDVPIDEGVRSTLRFDTGREVHWLERPAATDGNGIHCFLFFFRWEPGASTILRARAHRPDVCLPNTGWHVTADHGVRRYLVSGDFELPVRHFSFQRQAGGGFADAFFCMREDKIPTNGPAPFDLTAGAPNDWMVSDRVRVVRQGLRNPGQQVMEVVLLHPERLDPAVTETFFANLAKRIVVVEQSHSL